MLQINDFIIDKPEEELFAYHRSTMTSPEIFALEQQRIFETCWLYLGHESEIPHPGDFVRLVVAVALLGLTTLLASSGSVSASEADALIGSTCASWPQLTKTSNARSSAVNFEATCTIA